MRAFLALLLAVLIGGSLAPAPSRASGIVTVMQATSATQQALLRAQQARSVIQRPSVSDAQKFAQMLMPIPADTLRIVTPYTGPCDVTLSSPCISAYSTARSMKSSYSGALFQVYDGTSTTDITQVGHIANNALLLSACANKPTCVISKVYDNIGSNDVTPPATVQGNVPSVCTSTYACAPPVIIDPDNGLPVVATVFPSMLYRGSSVTGITAGTGPMSVFMYGNNAGVSDCCGPFGVAHSFTAAATAATDFLPGLGYGNGHVYQNCSSSTTICAHIDIETYMDNGGDYTPTSLQTVSYMATAAGGSGNITVYVNSATPIYTGAPSHSTSLNVGVYPRIGAGGDGSHVNTVFQEGYIANAAWSATDYTNISGNISTFYGGRSRDACSSIADLRYYWGGAAGQSVGSQSANAAPLSALVAYGLRRMRASYYGPIATLRRASDNAEQTFGPNATGCDIDAAAATFCNATTCYVKTAFNQGTLSTQNNGSAHDSGLDVTQATTAKQPSVNFTGLNSKPTMVFSGGQYLCGGTMGSTGGGNVSLIAAVAKRASAPTSYNAVFNVTGDDNSIGFDNVSGGIYASLVGAGGYIHSGALTENHWHSLVTEITGTGAGQLVLYGDNTSVVTGTSGIPLGIGGAGSPPCIGIDKGATTPQYYLNGEIAEVAAIGNFAPGGTVTSTRSSVFTAQQSAWGTLPN